MVAQANYRPLHWLTRSLWGAAGYSAAFGANLCTAACAALANALLFLAAAALVPQRYALLAGATAATSFGLAPLTWQYATLSEVFALNNALIAGAFLALARFELALARGDVGGARWSAGWGALAIGLGISNQHTILFYALPAGFWVVIVRYFCAWRGPGGAAAMGAAMTALLLGLLPHLYLPWASSRTLPGSWGSLTTFSGLWRHLSREEYGSLRLYSGADAGAADLAMGLTYYFWGALEALGPLGALCAAVGVAVALFGGGGGAKARLRGGEVAQLQSAARVVMRLALACFLLYTVGFHALANLPIYQPLHFGVLQRFWLQSHLALALLAGYGHAEGARMLQNRTGVSAAAVTVAVLSVAAIRCFAQWGTMDESANAALVDYARAVLAPLPMHARIIVKGDLITNGMRYLQVCEGVRPDVQMVDQAMLTYPWFIETQAGNLDRWVWPRGKRYYHPYDAEGFSMRELLDSNYAVAGGERGDGSGSVLDDPIFIAGGLNEQDSTTDGAYNLLVWGMVELAIPVREGFISEADYARWAADVAPLTPPLAPVREQWLRWDETRWERIAFDDRFTMHQKLGYGHLMFGLTNKESGRRHEAVMASLAAYQALDAAHPQMPAEHCRNLAIAANAVSPDALAAGAISERQYLDVMSALGSGAGRWLAGAPEAVLEANGGRERNIFEQMVRRAEHAMVRRAELDSVW